MTVEELVKEICIFIAKNAYRESMFLTPDPAWMVDPYALLDRIHDVTGVPKQVMQEIIDEVHDGPKKKRRTSKWQPK